MKVYVRKFNKIVTISFLLTIDNLSGAKAERLGRSERSHRKLCAPRTTVRG